MALSRNRLYSILMIACIAGYIWIYFSLWHEHAASNSANVCMFKQITNMPCPSCGSTRSITNLTKGNFKEALAINPLGYFIATVMILAPLWIIADIISKRNSLYNFYQKTEAKLKKPAFAIPLVIIVIMNWIWNITKGL